MARSPLWRIGLARKTRSESNTKATRKQGEVNMAKVAQEMVKQAGVNLDDLLEVLVSNAAAELTTYYYTILRVNLIGLEGEGIKEIAEVARVEDRNHFEALVPRIYELGGKLPENMKDFHDLSTCRPARQPRCPRIPGTSRPCSRSWWKRRDAPCGVTPRSAT
jgi:hypothetical protein